MSFGMGLASLAKTGIEGIDKAGASGGGGADPYASSQPQSTPGMTLQQPPVATEGLQLPQYTVGATPTPAPAAQEKSFYQKYIAGHSPSPEQQAQLDEMQRAAAAATQGSMSQTGGGQPMAGTSMLATYMPEMQMARNYA